MQNFTTIQGDERRKLISEFGTLAKQQADVTSAVLNQSIIEKSKEFMEKYGSKDSGASLGDILGKAISDKKSEE